jgi:transposase
MNRGRNLTMIGALRRDGWLTMGTIWGAANTKTFVDWVRRRLAPKLRPDDIVVMDNLLAHKAALVRILIENRGAQLVFLPPYSPDLNPIEPAWALIKKRLRALAIREKERLRQVAQNVWRVVRPRHCEGWFRHAGYHQAN